MGYIKIISGILIIVVAILSFKHGLDGLRNTTSQADTDILKWGIGKPLQTILSITNIIIALMIMFPQTFLVGNIISAMVFILLMCFQLNSGNVKAAASEIPFILITLLMIYLGHPFKK
jgi:hypothetical protein